MQHSLLAHPVLVHVGTKLGGVVLKHCHSLVVNILLVQCVVGAVVIVVRNMRHVGVRNPRRLLRRYKPCLLYTSPSPRDS